MPPRSTFAYDARILACSGCGAPLDAPLAGGTFTCTYCEAENLVAARVEGPVIEAGASGPVDEAERVQRLRAQDGKPLLPPDSLRTLVGPGGDLPEWKVQEAVEIWQSARRELAKSSSFEAAERLLYLTLTLANHFAGNNDQRRQRAMFESALEVFFLPRHRQLMRGHLARSAAQEGDLQAAERWLEPCDTRSDDLDTDSAYRFSRAFIDTGRREFREVLRVLGHGSDDVPIMDAMDTSTTLLRANAWEQLGQPDRAVALLMERMKKGGVNARRAMKIMVGRYADWGLCRESYARAAATYRDAAAEAAGEKASGGIGLIFVPIGCLFLLLSVGLLLASAILLALTRLTGADFGETTLITGVTGAGLLIPGLAMGGVGIQMRRAAKKAQRLRRHGLSGFGEVLGMEATGTKINDVPVMRIRLRIQLEGRSPYEASTKMLLNSAERAQFITGRTVPVRVDPEDRTEVIVETN